MAQNLEILAAVRVALQQAGFLKVPKVAIHPSCGAVSVQLAALVIKLGGELMPSASAHTAYSWLNAFGSTTVVSSLGFCKANSLFPLKGVCVKVSPLRGLLRLDPNNTDTDCE